MPNAQITKYSDLYEEELFWVEHQPELAGLGYQLRARFHPGWQTRRPRRFMDFFKPAHAVRGKDSVPLPVWTVIDAIRTKDETPVIIKMLTPEQDELSQEVPITQLLSRPELRTASDNHCVPLLSLLRLPSCPDTKLLVLPRLVDWKASLFLTVSEVVEFMSQLLSGLAFMHRNGVAHCDISHLTVMMDGLHLFRDPPHPWKSCWTEDLSRWSELSGREGKGVTYYYVNFSSSCYFPPRSNRKVATGQYGYDLSVPEFRGGAPFDPFMVDVYCVGRLFLLHCTNAYNGLDFLQPLVAAMVNEDPDSRPSAADCVTRFKELVDHLGAESLTIPIKRVESWSWLEFVTDEYVRQAATVTTQTGSSAISSSAA